MDLQAAYRARLLSNAELTSLLGQRVTWGGRPQASALPAIVLTKAAPGQDWTHAGPDPLVNPWVQADIYAADFPTAGAVSAALQGEMQRPDDVTAGGWRFEPPGMLVAEQWPGIEDLIGGGQAHRIVHDYRFWASPA
jgi:hypothetical protein